MSQVTSMTVANGTGLAVRTAINTILEALASLSSGATAPTNTRAGQGWFDTANGVLKIRNSANNGWITLQTTANALSAVAALTPAANRIAYYTSGTAAALATLTAFGRSIMAVNDDAAMRSLIGVGANFGATATQITDWNSATECGSYWSASADGASNCPDGDNGRTWMGTVTAAAANNLVQMLTPTNSNLVYIRRRLGGAWAAWVQFQVREAPRVWSDVTSSRVKDAVYTNTTGRDMPIYVQASGGGNNYRIEVSTNGTTWVQIAGSILDGSVHRFAAVAIIPDGARYRQSGGNNEPTVWTEGR